MKKRILFSIGTIVAVAVGIIGMSAFEAHIINVTAQIENALYVPIETSGLNYGTVFPQEKLDATFDVAFSTSFDDELQADDINYVIRQKPKCIRDATADITLPQYGRATEDNDTYVCEDEVNYNLLPVLCPFLSKHELTTDGQNSEENDGPGIPPFHGLEDGVWTPADTDNFEASGRLAKSEFDDFDTWNIDFRVPCFEGQCAQDWDEFVFDNNPNVNADDYVLPSAQEHELFGCDLWLEVTGISRTDGGGDDGQICNEADVMLVLDRSGSVINDLDTLKSAAHDFVHALNPDGGVHVGQSSFADSGSLDTELTGNHAMIDTNIFALIADGSTDLASGISLADTELMSPRDRNDLTFPDYMIIITDGEPNVGGNPQGAATAAADAAKANDVIIYVVGVGTTQGTSDFLRDNIATDMDHYFDIVNYSELEAVLADIAQCEGAGNNVGSNVSAYTQPTCDLTVTNGQSIQTDGVNTASAGDTVCVDDGTYTGNVTVDRALTLVALNGPTNSATIDGVVEITANNVTVRGFNITGAPSTAPNYAGIYIWVGTSGHRIEDNILSGSDTANSRGILFGYDVSDVIVKNNLIQDWQSGSYINPTTVGGITFILNDFDSNTVGIGSDSISNVGVYYNEFDGNTAEAIGMSDDERVVLHVDINSNNFLPAGLGNNVNAYGTVGDVDPVDAMNNWWDSEAEGDRTNDIASIDTTGPAGALFPHN